MLPSSQRNRGRACRHQVSDSNELSFSARTDCRSRQDPLLGLYSVSYMWYTPIAVATVLLVGLIVSYATGPMKRGEVNPKYLISIGDVCCCCLPERARRWLRCGVDFDKQAFEETEEIEMANTPSEKPFHASNRVSPLPAYGNAGYPNLALTTNDGESRF